eukprot:186140-Hanusia_phi.AAC.1
MIESGGGDAASRRHHPGPSAFMFLDGPQCQAGRVMRTVPAAGCSAAAASAAESHGPISAGRQDRRDRTGQWVVPRRDHWQSWPDSPASNLKPWQA